MYEWAVFCMNGQFPIGTISPWRYFASIGFFIACLLSMSDDDNALPIWLNFIIWQVQVFSGLAFFIATNSAIASIQNWSVAAWHSRRSVQQMSFNSSDTTLMRWWLRSLFWTMFKH